MRVQFRRVAPVGARSGEGPLTEPTVVAQVRERERVFMAPEPTFAIRLRMVEKCQAWNTLGWLHLQPTSRLGRAYFAWVGYPAELHAAMDDPVVDGHSSEKIR